MDGKNVIVLLLLCLGSHIAASQQRQLIVLKNEEVLARYQEGDVIHFARANDKEILVQRILDMNDTLLMMNSDSVAYFRIKKLDIRGRKKSTFLQKIGGGLIVAGLGLPIVEVINTGLVQDEGVSVSKGVTVTSLALIGAGAAFIFIRKPYFKPGRKYHLLIVDKRSPFYKAKPKQEGYVSPYIPN